MVSPEATPSSAGSIRPRAVAEATTNSAPVPIPPAPSRLAPWLRCAGRRGWRPASWRPRRADRRGQRRQRRDPQRATDRPLHAHGHGRGRARSDRAGWLHDRSQRLTVPTAFSPPTSHDRRPIECGPWPPTTARARRLVARLSPLGYWFWGWPPRWSPESLPCTDSPSAITCRARRPRSRWTRARATKRIKTQRARAHIHVRPPAATSTARWPRCACSCCCGW